MFIHVPLVLFRFYIRQSSPLHTSIWTFATNFENFNAVDPDHTFTYLDPTFLKRLHWSWSRRTATSSASFCVTGARDTTVVSVSQWPSLSVVVRVKKGAAPKRPSTEPAETRDKISKASLISSFPPKEKLLFYLKNPFDLNPPPCDVEVCSGFCCTSSKPWPPLLDIIEAIGDPFFAKYFHGTKRVGFTIMPSEVLASRTSKYSRLLDNKDDPFGG